MSTPPRLLLPAQLLQTMVSQAQAELPNECCGLLAGRVDEGVWRLERCYPLVNEAASPVEYASEPRSLLAAVKDMRQRGIDLLAIYHSHPTSAPLPSRTDLARNFYGPEVAHFIVGLAGKEPEVRGWWLGETGYREAAWEITSPAQEALE